MNSASEGLYFGVPLVLFPQTPEQDAVAKRTEELGAGVRLKSISEEDVLDALTKVINEPQYKDAIALVDMENEYYPQMFMRYAEEDQNTLAVTQAAIANVTESYWGIWLTGEAEIEDTWEDYLAEVEAAGLSEVLAIRQAAYDAWKAQATYFNEAEWVKLMSEIAADPNANWLGRTPAVKVIAKYGSKADLEKLKAKVEANSDDSNQKFVLEAIDKALK